MDNPQKTNDTIQVSEHSDLIAMINHLIAEKGISVVARAMGLPPSKLQYLSRGGGLTLETILKLSKALHIDWNAAIYQNNEAELSAMQKVVGSESVQKELEELREKVKETEKLRETLLLMQGELKAYQNMMNNVIPFRKTLNEDELKEKLASFKLAHEEALIYTLNYDESKDEYNPEISEVGFTPNWMKRVKNASRA